MSAPTPTRSVSVSIHRAPQEVYDYIIDHEHLPTWVPSFAKGVRRAGDGWVVETAEGPATLEFVPRNPLFVADHVVRIGDVRVLNPLRVIPNGDGAEAVFTLIQEPGQSDSDFDDLAGVVRSDLGRLRAALES